MYQVSTRNNLKNHHCTKSRQWNTVYCLCKHNLCIYINIYVNLYLYIYITYRYINIYLYIQQLHTQGRQDTATELKLQWKQSKKEHISMSYATFVIKERVNKYQGYLCQQQVLPNSQPIILIRNKRWQHAYGTQDKA